jgi:hypothetical protein
MPRQKVLGTASVRLNPYISRMIAVRALAAYRKEILPARASEFRALGRCGISRSTSGGDDDGST